MSAPDLVVVVFAAEPPPLPSLAALGVRRVVAAGGLGEPPLRAEVDDSHTLWLPAWTELTPRLVTAVADWLARASPPRVATVPLRLCCGTTSARLTPRVVLSTPGSVVLDGDVPRARPGVASDVLGDAWDVQLPDLTGHLEGVNLQTSIAARLRHADGHVATWRDFTVTPLALALRTLATVSGSRRVALPHVVIEAYREILVTAKLWELSHGPSVA